MYSDRQITDETYRRVQRRLDLEDAGSTSRRKPVETRR
jgi:hypothetical protein